MSVRSRTASRSRGRLAAFAAIALALLAASGAALAFAFWPDGGPPGKPKAVIITPSLVMRAWRWGRRTPA